MNLEDKSIKELMALQKQYAVKTLRAIETELRKRAADGDKDAIKMGYGPAILGLDAEDLYALWATDDDPPWVNLSPADKDRWQRVLLAIEEDIKNG